MPLVAAEPSPQLMLAVNVSCVPAEAFVKPGSVKLASWAVKAVFLTTVGSGDAVAVGATFAIVAVPVLVPVALSLSVTLSVIV